MHVMEAHTRMPYYTQSRIRVPGVRNTMPPPPCRPLRATFVATVRVWWACRLVGSLSQWMGMACAEGSSNTITCTNRVPAAAANGTTSLLATSAWER